tara:strand:+ start:254 stop:1114 length:861 start_codon:yes stop_codon:yes gene_type:complete
MPNSILNDTNRAGLNIYLQSHNATISNSDSDKVFNFQDFISVPPDQNIIVALTSFEMPNTLYNINAPFNTLTINGTSGSHQITLTPKNYNATQMKDELNSKFASASFLSDTGLSSLVVSFDDQSFKYTFTGNANFSITECTFDTEIGLENQIPTTSNTSYECVDIILLGGISSIYVGIKNLGISNIDSRGATDNTIAKLNVKSSLGDYIFYDGEENNYFLCNRREINTLEVLLTDDKNRPLKMNGGKFSLTLNFHYSYKRNQKILHEYYLNKDNMIIENNKNENKK